MKFCERLPGRTVYHVSLAEIVPPFDVRYHSTGTSSNNSSWLRVSDRDSGEINYRWDASARGRSNKTTLSNATFEPLPDKLHRRGIIGPGPKRWSIIQRSHFAAGTRDWPQNRRQIRIVDKRARVRPIRRLLVLLYSLSFSLPLWSLSLSIYTWAVSNEFRFNWHDSGSLFPAGIPSVKILNRMHRKRPCDSTFLPYRYLPVFTYFYT